jgi:hypothetical protein
VALPRALRKGENHESRAENERKLLSGVDILANAQFSAFSAPNLDPYAVPEPGGLALPGVGMAVMGVFVAGRACRSGQRRNR